MDTRHRKIDTCSIGHKIDTGNIEHKTQKDRQGQQWTQDTERQTRLTLGTRSLVSNVTCVYLSVSFVQCYPCLSFCVLCPMLPVSIFLCLVANVTCVYLFVSCVQCYLCLSFCVLCPLLSVSIFLCLVTRHRKIDTCNIGNKTQKDRHG
jgi:hypothetical protein